MAGAAAANGLYMMTDKSKPTPGGRGVFSVGTMVVAGFAVALVATLFLQYTHGISHADGYATWYIPVFPFDRLSAGISELSAYDELSRAVSMAGWERLGAIRADMTMLGWVAAGLLLVVACSFMRTHFAWWLPPRCPGPGHGRSPRSPGERQPRPQAR